MKTMNYAPAICPQCKCPTLDEQGNCCKCEFAAPVCPHCQDTGWRCDSIGCTVTLHDPICYFQCNRLSVCDCQAGTNQKEAGRKWWSELHTPDPWGD